MNNLNLFLGDIIKNSLRSKIIEMFKNRIPFKYSLKDRVKAMFSFLFENKVFLR